MDSRQLDDASSASVIDSPSFKSDHWKKVLANRNHSNNPNYSNYSNCTGYLSPL